MKRFIYATNRSQIIYKFTIVDENENEYVVNDKDFYPYNDVKFFINKENLCIARCEEKQWDFIVKEDFFASFELNDVQKEFYKRQITIKEKEVLRKESELSELENEHNKKTKKTYNDFFSFNDFKLNDTLYVLYEKKLYETKVVSFMTVDKVNFVPNVQTYFGGCIEDYATLEQDKNGELYINVNERDYDYFNNANYKVFLSRVDYDIYLEMVEYENEIVKINKFKSSIIIYKSEIEKLNKLISEL